MAQTVPYRVGMDLGQGFNSFLQKTCRKGVVKVEHSDKDDPGYHITYDSIEIQDYDSLAKSLGINAGAAISGWGQSGSVDTEYLSRSDWESSTVTYEVRVQAEQQTSTTSKYTYKGGETDNPNRDYGDRFISDFVKGGYFFGRISIKAHASSSKEEIRVAAKLACTMYGFEGEVSTEVKTAVETLQKHSEIEVHYTQSGGGSFRKVPKDSGKSQFEALRDTGNQFAEEAKHNKHNYIRFALLEPYTNISNFNHAFTPFNYTKAIEFSWHLFDDFTEYHAMEGFINDIPSSKFIHGETQGKWQKEVKKQIQAIEDQIQAINNNPENLNNNTHQSPEKVWINILKEIKLTRYIAQGRSVKNGQSFTDIAQTTLISNAEKLFEFNGLDFGSVFGTTVISFGKKQNSEEFGCFIGQRAYEFSDWKEESHLWAFAETKKTFTTMKVVATRPYAMNLVRLQGMQQDATSRHTRANPVTFFVPSAK